MPESVTYIGTEAFNRCRKLVSVNIPKNVEYIGAEAFSLCDGLKLLTVDVENKNFYSVGNCIVEKETGTLTHGCVGSVIPSDGSVKHIGDFAFSCNAVLKTFTIPEGVESIGEFAFSACYNLVEISIPESVKSIGQDAFLKCESLREITYAGTREQWAGVKKAEDWDKNAGNYTVKYADKE